MIESFYQDISLHFNVVQKMIDRRTPIKMETVNNNWEKRLDTSPIVILPRTTRLLVNSMCSQTESRKWVRCLGLHVEVFLIWTSYLSECSYQPTGLSQVGRLAVCSAEVTRIHEASGPGMSSYSESSCGAYPGEISVGLHRLGCPHGIA